MSSNPLAWANHLGRAMFGAVDTWRECKRQVLDRLAVARSAYTRRAFGERARSQHITATSSASHRTASSNLALPQSYKVNDVSLYCFNAYIPLDHGLLCSGTVDLPRARTVLYWPLPTYHKRIFLAQSVFITSYPKVRAWGCGRWGLEMGRLD